MKNILTSILVCALLALTGCATDSTGKKTLTPTAKADITAAGNIVTAALASALSNGVVQLTTTGSVNAKKLASDSVYAVAANLQPYVGTIAPATAVTQATGVASIGSQLGTVALNQVISQNTVDALDAQAAKLLK
jgi:hypothetical protein